MKRRHKSMTLAALKIWLPWLAFGLVFGIALATGGMLYQLESVRHRAQFALAATERMNVLEVGIPSFFRPVQHIGAVFQEEELSEGSFRRLAESLPLARSPALVALQWITREPRASGSDFFAIRYSLSPGREVQEGPGAELNVESQRSFQRAAEQRHLFVAPWFPAQGQVRFRVSRPISRIEAGGQVVRGFVSGVYRVDEMLAEVLCPSENEAIQLFVSDPRSEIQTSFHCSDGKVRTVQTDTEPATSNHRLTLTRRVRIGGPPGAEGAHWRVTAMAEPGTFAASRWIPLVVGLGGFLFGGVLALFLRFMLNREAEVRQLVQHRTNELARRSEQLQAMNSELEQFAYVASHDLKAPLRAVSHLASWIDEDAAATLDEENRERLRLMRERVIRMDRLIDGLLAYSRAGRTTSGLHVPVQLEPLLDETRSELPLPTGFQVSIEKPLPALKADSLHLKQIFQNLITNAAEHHDHPESGTVRISAQEERRQWRLEIADDGPGIPATERERVFRIFTSLGASAGADHTGVGLAIVRKLIRSYGGQIDVIDNTPRGARFRIWWPK